MREIKFRAFYANKMHENQEALRLLTNSSAGFDWTTAHIMQYTGLKDKNGVEIYEGDIVIHFGDTMEIVNRHGAFYHKHKTAEAYGSMHSIHYPYAPPRIDEYYEVIGNIHQNPELL